MSAFLGLLLNLQAACAQSDSTLVKIKNRFINETRFNKKTIYLFCRGSLSKNQIIAKYFNVQDTLSTHIGIGFVEKGKAKVYHVTTMSHNNAYVCETLEEFVQGDDMYSFQIWRVKMNRKERKKVRDYCLEFGKRNIVFDSQFTISNDDTLYCSEFCANLLRFVDARKFDFRPRFKVIENTFFELVLHRQRLVYYPIDFFQAHPGFKKVATYIFKK